MSIKPRQFSNEEISSIIHKQRDARILQRAAFLSVGGPALPGVSEQVKSLAKSGLNWAKKGFVLVNEEQLNSRLAECSSCEFWDPKAFLGTGRCQKCGCSTQAKLRMATEKCPIDKWGPVTPPSPEQTQQPNTN
jgi:hypothetical protein